MDTAVLTPLKVFGLPQRLVVPLFQRPYVWDLDEQWSPLWDDVRRVAELRLAQPWLDATHFLGAVVLQAIDNPIDQLGARAIIDGQQRLTTLQLLIDAVSAVFEDLGLDDLAVQLSGLAHNPDAYVKDKDTLKLRHGNRDVDAFREVMLADPPVNHASLVHRDSRLARAHRFFSGAAREWMDEESATVPARAAALAAVLANGLQLVVIDLGRNENSQEIFETLNARGTPLTAADLIKNFVFQQLASEKVDAQHAYQNLWPFDTKFWDREVSVGRFLVSRSSLFFNQWLASRVGVEIGPTSTFTRFKSFFEHEANLTMTELLAAIKQQAALYQSWTERAADPHADLSPVELCVYRSQAMQSEVLKPLLIWLHEPGREVSHSVVTDVVSAAESWLIRRSLLRLASADLGRVVADLITLLRDVPPTELGARVQTFLSGQTAASTYWPADDELRTSMREELAYRRFKRGRLRMYLEAAEDFLRGYTRPGPSKVGARVPRVGYSIEHVLPQRWRTSWPVDGLGAELSRDAHVHRLGNLTLLTTSLNSSVSNGPWLGANGKRVKLDEHDVMLMNRDIRQTGKQGWSESSIDGRTDRLVDAFVQTWPTPEGHTGRPADVVTELDQQYVSVADLVVAGLLEVGTMLTARPGIWGQAQCEVLSDGSLGLDGAVFASLSTAGHHLRKGSTNGWWFWSMPDGRRMKDVRAAYLARAHVPNATMSGEGLPLFDDAEDVPTVDIGPAAGH